MFVLWILVLLFSIVMNIIRVTEPTTHKAATYCGPRWDIYSRKYPVQNTLGGVFMFKQYCNTRNKRIKYCLKERVLKNRTLFIIILIQLRLVSLRSVCSGKSIKLPELPLSQLAEYHVHNTCMGVGECRQLLIFNILLQNRF